jgi:hypothetical protein
MIFFILSSFYFKLTKEKIIQKHVKKLFDQIYLLDRVEQIKELNYFSRFVSLFVLASFASMFFLHLVFLPKLLFILLGTFSITFISNTYYQQIDIITQVATFVFQHGNKQIKVSNDFKIILYCTLCLVRASDSKVHLH